MLIEEIIELQLRGLGPPNQTCTPITAYFYDKTKTRRENLRVDYYLLLKCSTRQSALLPLPRLNHLQLNLSPRCQMLNVFWT